MKISYYLKEPNSTIDTAIYATICYSGLRLRYYVGESINPKYWSKTNQRAKQNIKFTHFREFNSRLDNIKSTIENTYRTYLNDNGIIPSTATLKDLLNNQVKEIEVDTDKSFFEFFESIIKQSESGVRSNPKTGKPISKNTIRTYQTTFRHLTEFQKVQRKKFDFNSIDLDFYDDYTKHLIGKTLSNNTIGKHFQIIKMVLNEAYERGMEVNTSYRSRKFKVIRENTESIYLNESEIRELEKLDLSYNKRLESVRDLFLIGCWTGFRYSDYSDLKPENFTSDGFLERIQTKTRDKVVIPIHPKVKSILSKYEGKLPKSISNQKTNDYLKEIGSKVKSMHQQVSKTTTKGGQAITRNFKKYELLTTHTARRSFATNEYLQGTPTQTIMQITGHKTEKAFMKYIKLSNREHAKVLQMNWNKRYANAQ